MGLSLLQAAILYHKAGFIPVPISISDGKKLPIIKGWSNLNQISLQDVEAMPWQKATGLALLVKGFEVIDFDLKNSIDKQIFEDWKTKVGQEAIKDTLIIKTINAGYHVIYRTENIEGSQKLALAPDGSVIIETRGDKSLVITTPTPGYERLQNNWASLTFVTKETRSALLDAAKSFTNKQPIPETKTIFTPGSLSIFDRFNADNPVEDIANYWGWKTIDRDSERIYLNRPGGHGEDPSANIRNGLMYVHTQSSDLQEGKAYSSFALWLHYSFRNDKKAAVRELYKIYPDTVEPQQLIPTPDAYEWNPNDEIVDLVPAISIYKNATVKHIVPTAGLLTFSGKAGVGKTMMARAMVASALSGKIKAGICTDIKGKILWVETEQPKAVFQRTMHKIIRQSGGQGQDRIIGIWLVDHDPQQRLETVYKYVNRYTTDIGLIVIDGYRDLVNDVNDVNEANKIITAVMKWRSMCDCVVTGIIHLNEGTEKLRGHLGTELTNKSDAILIVKPGDGSITATFKRTRSWANPGDWDIFVDDDFIPYSPEDPDRQYIDNYVPF